MFWTRITKGFLRVQVGIGVIASIVAAFATRSLLGIVTFIVGLLITFAVSCVLGTFVEIAEAVTKLSSQIVGQTASERELNRRLNSIEIGMEKMMDTAKRQGSAAVKKTAEKIAGSIPDYDMDKQLNFTAEDGPDDMDKQLKFPKDDGSDDMDKTTVLPMDVIMDKVNGDTHFCPSCGAKNNKESAFCFNCGSKL